MTGTSASELPVLPQKSKFAVYSLAFALLNLFCVLPLIGAVLAIYCGVLARRAIRASDGKLEGLGTANWGIMLGIGGIFYSIVLIYVPVVGGVLVYREMGKIDAIVAEFKEAYAAGDAAAIHAKLSPQGREKMGVERLREQIEASRKNFGTFETFRWDAWDFFWNSQAREDRAVSFPYDMQGPRGAFRGVFTCRKVDDVSWRLESFEFVPAGR